MLLLSVGVSVTILREAEAHMEKVQLGSSGLWVRGGRLAPTIAAVPGRKLRDESGAARSPARIRGGARLHDRTTVARLVDSALNR